MYTSIIGECNETISSDGEEIYLGVSYETGKHYFSDVANCTKHGISKGEASQIIDRMWPEPMSREQFKKSIEFKLTYKQLENIYDEVLGIEKINRYAFFTVKSHYVTKNRVKAYLLSQQHQYGLNEKEVKEIIKPLKNNHMSWEEFRTLIIVGK
ncbi:uncharacterized protein LOC126837301 isoform X4 [Adelges cooleyi]|uniref:uncharacterized protein LOC126837301 isoform X3 n=1 Tax=Adelges cooleyi TaxID=133065 RepID=UPI0021805A1F|nr:uncharacterized protein LOC126837301 isoform X3 [Adelges cooleyi]XP_050427106.1 uncharacterized protein LOC126837301 isoform X4 [Adelges cooleyi]